MNILWKKYKSDMMQREYNKKNVQGRYEILIH
jgi:hypothetical protein